MVIAFFLLVLTLETIIYFLSRAERYFIFNDLDQKQYPFKSTFMPMGYCLLKNCGYKFTGAYDSRIYNWLAELHDYKEARTYLQIHWAQKMGNVLLALLAGGFLLAAYGEADAALFVFTLGIALLCFFLPDYELRKRLQERHLLIRLDFPEFINKLILLVNAGMTVGRAWERVVTATQKDTPLYREVTRVSREIKGGKNEGEAYEEFARRCRTPEIARFVTVILQNLRKGNAEMVAVLRVQANECWEMRKHAAKRLGEEASTKLLLPMMLMFLAILIIVATPAMLALRNM